MRYRKFVRRYRRYAVATTPELPSLVKPKATAKPMAWRYATVAAGCAAVLLTLLLLPRLQEQKPPSVKPTAATETSAATQAELSSANSTTEIMNISAPSSAVRTTVTTGKTVADSTTTGTRPTAETTGRPSAGPTVQPTSLSILPEWEWKPVAETTAATDSTALAAGEGRTTVKTAVPTEKGPGAVPTADRPVTKGTGGSPSRPADSIKPLGTTATALEADSVEKLPGLAESVRAADRVVIGTVTGMQRYVNGTVFTLSQAVTLTGESLGDTTVTVLHTGEPAVTVGGRYLMLDGLGVLRMEDETLYSPYTIFAVGTDCKTLENRTPYWLENAWVRASGEAVDRIDDIRRLL